MFTLYWIAFVPPTRKALRPSMSSNGSRTSNVSSRSGWPRGLGKLLKSQASLLNIYFRLSGFQSSIPLIHFRYRPPNTCSHCTKGKMWHRTYIRRCALENGAAHLRSVIEIGPKPPFSHVNRGPIRYCFRDSAKAIRYNVNIASVIRDKQTNRKNLLKSVYSLKVSLKLHLKIFYRVG